MIKPKFSAHRFIPVFENWFICADSDVSEKQNWVFSHIGLGWVMKTTLKRARLAEDAKPKSRREAAAAAAAAKADLEKQGVLPDAVDFSRG